jgi:hypothetical protein
MLADKATMRVDAPRTANIHLPREHGGHIAPYFLFEDFKTNKTRANAKFESRFLSLAPHAAGGNVTRLEKGG